MPRGGGTKEDDFSTLSLPPQVRSGISQRVVGNGSTRVSNLIHVRSGPCLRVTSGLSRHSASGMTSGYVMSVDAGGSWRGRLGRMRGRPRRRGMKTTRTVKSGVGSWCRSRTRLPMAAGCHQHIRQNHLYQRRQIRLHHLE